MRLFRIISILFLLGYSRGGPYLLFADEGESTPSAETESAPAPSTPDTSVDESVIQTPTETTIYEPSESEADGDTDTTDISVPEGETVSDPVAELAGVVEAVPPAADPNPASSIPAEQNVVEIPSPVVTSGAGEDIDTSIGTADPETIVDTGSVVPYALETIYEPTVTGSAVEEEQIGTHLVFQTDTLTVSIPETVSVRTAGGVDIPTTDLSVTILTPTQAHEKVGSEEPSGPTLIPEIETGEVVPEQTFLDTISRYLGIARVFAIDEILPGVLDSADAADEVMIEQTTFYEYETGEEVIVEVVMKGGDDEIHTGQVLDELPVPTENILSDTEDEMLHDEEIDYQEIDDQNTEDIDTQGGDEVASSLVSDVAEQKTPPWSASFEFGIPETHLIFSDPVTIDYTVPFPDGTRMEVNVHHAGDVGRGMQGLSIFPEGACLPDGSHTDTTNIATVIGGKARIYTCGASVFMFTYTGGATTGNFVDNGTLTKTIVITTGQVTTGFTITDLNVIVDRQAIDSENPLSFGATNAYASEKSMTLQSPTGTTRTLVAAATYADGTAYRVVTTFDDEASVAPSGLPATGTFLPNQTLDAGGFSGQNPIGTWTFRLTDNAAQDGVILRGVTLQMSDIQCGDGMIVSGEACDDGNTNNGDGCAVSCTVEAGWSCTGVPSVCTLIPSLTGLILHYDGSTSGTGFADVSGSGNHGTIFNGVTTGSTNGEVIMCFNGTNQYVERVTNLVTAYPFTMSVWIKSAMTTGLHGVMSFARSTATNIMYNIEHNGTTIRQNGQNTTATYTNATTALNTTQWFLVTAVYNSATDRDIYVNGVFEATNTTSVTYDANVTKRLDIGRFADSTPTNYFSGCLDEVRFYGNALNSGQISTLYVKPAALTTSYTTSSSPALTGTIGSALDRITLTISGNSYTGTNIGNGTWSLGSGNISPRLASGTYAVTLTVTNPYDRAVAYTSSVVVSYPNICGDGVIAGGEACDDGNTNNGDGCAVSCTVEAGWSCTSVSPSVCTLLPSATGLILHYDSSMTGALFTDISGSGYHGTRFNGVTTGTANGEVYMCFNGTNQYVERVTNLVTSYPFTMSAWIRSATTVGVHGVMSFARSTATNRMYNIEHTGTTIRQNAQNTTATYTNATTALNTTQWFLVTAVYNSDTDRDIYVNGVFEATNTTNETYDGNVTKRLDIGRFADSTPTNYFSGCIDDVRFYGNAISTGQIYTLYAKPAALTTSYTTNSSPALTGTIGSTLDRISLTISGANYTGINLGNGTWSLSGGLITPALISGSYTTTLTITNPYDRAVVYTSAFTVELPPASTGDFCISAPASISFPAFSTEAYAQTATVASSGYFAVIDSSGIDSGYYTTLQITALTGSAGTIPTTGIARLSTGVVLLTGTTNTGVVLGSAFSGYHYATGTATFIYRNPAANGGKQGTYGAVLRLRLDLPAYIRPGAYAGTMTYTLYEN